MNPMKQFNESISSQSIRSSAPSIDNTAENKKFEDIVIEKTSVINKKKPKLKRFSEIASPSTLVNIVERTSLPFDKIPDKIIEENEEEPKQKAKAEPIKPKMPIFKFDDVETKTESKPQEPKKETKKNLFTFDDNDEEDFKPKISKIKEEKNKIKLIFDD